MQYKSRPFFIFIQSFSIDVNLYNAIPAYRILGDTGNGKVLNILTTSFTFNKLFIFYHYDTENMSISIGNKNQVLFVNQYGV